MMRFIGPLIMLAVSVGLFFAYTSKTYTSIQELRVKQAEYNDALSNAAELEAVRNQLIERYNMFDTQTLAELKKLLPDNVDNIKLILEINDVAVKYGMSLKNVKFQSNQTASPTTIEESNSRLAEKKKSYSSFNVEFSTEGTYSNFVLFLSDIEKSLRIVDVNSIAFSSPELPQTALGGLTNGKPKDSYKYDFSISTYWLKQ